MSLGRILSKLNSPGGVAYHADLGTRSNPQSGLGHQETSRRNKLDNIGGRIALRVRLEYRGRIRRSGLLTYNKKLRFPAEVVVGTVSKELEGGEGSNALGLEVTKPVEANVEYKDNYEWASDGVNRAGGHDTWTKRKLNWSSKGGLRKKLAAEEGAIIAATTDSSRSAGRREWSGNFYRRRSFDSLFLLSSSSVSLRCTSPSRTSSQSRPSNWYPTYLSVS